MNYEQMFLTIAVGASLAFGAPAVQAEYLSPSVEARLQAAADHGPDQLRQFVWRTRMIYALSIEDVSDRLNQAHDADLAGIPDEATVDTAGSEPEAAPSPKDDSFTREFFRNDARD